MNSSIKVVTLLAMVALVCSAPIKGKVKDTVAVDEVNAGLQVIAVVPAAPAAIATAAGNAVLSGKSPGALLTAEGILPPPPNAIGAPALSFASPPVITKEKAKLLSGLSVLSTGPLPMVGAVPV